MNKEDAKMRLQSKPLAAALWLNAQDRLEDSIEHLPDPAFTASQNWPEFAILQNQESQIEKLQSQKLQDGIDIEFIKSPLEELQAEPEVNEIIDLKPEEPTEAEHQTSEGLLLETKPVRPEEMKHSKKIARIAKKAKPIEMSGPEKKAKKAKVNELPEPEKKAKKPKEQEASIGDFYTWLKSFSTDPESSKTNENKPKKVAKSAKKPKEHKEKEKAEKSLKLGEEIVSETLARLLARQGYKEDAIAMYEKLRKKYPQKESTFAAAIEKLKS